MSHWNFLRVSIQLCDFAEICWHTKVQFKNRTNRETHPRKLFLNLFFKVQVDATCWQTWEQRYPANDQNVDKWLSTLPRAFMAWRCGKSCRFLKACQKILAFELPWKHTLSGHHAFRCDLYLVQRVAPSEKDPCPAKLRHVFRALRNFTADETKLMKPDASSCKAKFYVLFIFLNRGKIISHLQPPQRSQTSEMFPKHPRFADLATMMYKFLRKWNVYTSSTVASPPRAQQVQLRGREKVMMPGNNGQRKTARPTDEGRNWGKMLLMHDYSKDSRDQIWCNNWISRNYDHDQHVKSKHHKAGTAMMTMMLA